MNFPLVNIANKKSLVILFGRSPTGDLIIKKIHDFQPYYFEKDPKGEFKGYDGEKLRKIIVNEPNEIRELRSENAYEADIRYNVRYIIDKIDKFELCPIKWTAIDVEILCPKDTFPEPMEAKYPISSISLYNSKYNKYRTWYLGDYGADIKIGEQKLFVDFITYLRKAKFDIILGWNGVLFDYPYCYSSDTEVMTENGWMLLKDIVDQKLKIKVATLNPKTDKVEYHYPLDYIKYKYKGKMFWQSGRYIDSIVTPNHKLWVKSHTHSNPKQHEYHFVEAQKSLQSITFKKNFPFNKKEINWFVLPKKINSGWKKFRKSKKIPMDNWLRFLGWYLSEGHLYNSNNRTIVISQSKIANPTKCKEIENVLNALNLGWSYSGHKYCFSSVQLYEYLKQFGKSYQKFIPKNLLNKLNKAQSWLLLLTLIKGDGHIRKCGTYSYSTLSHQLAMDIQELALKSGYLAYVYKYHRKAYFNNSLHQQMKDSNYFIVFITCRNFNYSPNRSKDLRKYIDYNDFVYCLTVPNNLLFVRRKINDYHWSGNCYNRFSKLSQKLFFEKESKYNNFAKAISPIGEVRSSGIKDVDMFFPAGTSIIDYIAYLKRVYKEERSYALDAIMEKYLGKGKEFKDVDFSKLNEQVKLRNQGDVKGMVELELNKFKLIPLYDEIRRFAKVGWEDFNYNSRIIDSLILQEAKIKKVILPMGKSYGGTKEDKFEGAYRATLETGSFFNVGKYDLDSCYLNIIKGLNLDTANITDGEGIKIDITDRKTNTILHSYKVKQNSNAIIPSVVSKLLEAKVKYKKLKKDTDASLPEYKDVELKYNAIKAVILSCWGVLGNEYFRLFDKRVAEMITSTSRELLHYLENKAKDNGYKVIYLDTDSIFCIDNGKDISKFLNDSIQEWANNKFGKGLPINLEKEGNFNSLIILKMCRYKGFLQTPKGINEEIKGIQVKRRDSSNWIIKFQDTLLNKILNKETESSIMEWVKSEMERIKSVPIQDISFPCKYNKKEGDYKTTITNKKGKTYEKDVPIFARALRNSNLKLRLGESYFWCYVKSNDPKDNVMAFTENNQEDIKKLEIDWDMMTQRNILAICETIFDAMKYENSFIPKKVKRERKKKETIEPIKSQPTYTESDFLQENGNKENKPKIEPYYFED
jgi:DNA polymerase elongation subunit (family B)